MFLEDLANVVDVDILQITNKNGFPTIKTLYLFFQVLS